MPSITIVYRAYPRISRTPVIPVSTKLDLMMFGLSSLATALDGIEADFVFLSDACTSEQKDAVRAIMTLVVTSYREVELGGVGNQESFRRQLEEGATATSGYVLLLEDDYYIDPADVAQVIGVLAEDGADYVTFYFPEDAEAEVGGMIGGQRTLASGTTVTDLPSTTLTFAARRETLAADLGYFMEFAKGGSDCALWLRLTGRFGWFTTRFRYPMFRSNPRLFLHIVRSYARYMLRHPIGRRRLVHVGSGRSSHLETAGVYRRFGLPQYLRQVAATILPATG